MTRVLPRTNFHSSTLIRCLTDLGMIETVEPESAFAEKLGLWIHFTDAISLSAVHNDDIGNSAKAKPAVHANPGSELERIQNSLKNSIVKSCTPGVGKSHISLPIPILELPLDLATAYLPYRRFYDAHQRDMELSLQPLRFNVREMLAKASPTLKKLAELDVVMESILRERESKLLMMVPMLLKKRFEQLFKAHQQTLVETRQTDNPAGWTKTGAWLARFYQDMQTLLLAELELRLQPTIGLAEAFKGNMQSMQ